MPALIARNKVLKVIGVAILAITMVGVLIFLYVEVVAREIDERIAQIHSAQGSQFFGTYPAIKPGMNFRRGDWAGLLMEQGYEEVRDTSSLLAGRFSWSHESGDPEILISRPSFDGAGKFLDHVKFKIRLEQKNDVLSPKEIVRMDTGETVDKMEWVPKRIGSFVAGRLRTQNSVPLSDIPVSVRLAVMAIEDINFLEHPGVSFRSTVRALWRDIRARRYVEGGSTLTQQLMKNLFFSHEKAITRKIKEALFAFITESRHSKEAILEAYLNEVYLGQWSTHEIHGVSEGAEFYFHRPVSELTLSQSATIASIIQAPGVNDPYRYPDHVIKRRNLVLKQMLNVGFISTEEYQEATEEPLDVVPIEHRLDDVDYFLDLVLDKVPPEIKKELDTRTFYIYTTLNPYLQNLATRALRSHLDRLVKDFPKVSKREKSGVHLQSALLAVDPRTCNVLALQGGKSYRQTQFNRVLVGKRQPGSLFKPFVYLTAFGDSAQNPPITPLTQLDDSPFEWKYDKQLWKPHDYEKENRGIVSAQFALENSMNIPTARLAQKIGIDPVVANLRKAGVRSPLPALPSLSLGSAEVSPFEMTEAYTTLANVGKYCELQPITEVFDENRNLIVENKQTSVDSLNPKATFVTLQVMKGVLTEGTAKIQVKASGLELSHFAGKTGTTNDFRDAWFAGFSPSFLALTWCGYDEDEKVGLAGSVAALPLWLDFIRASRGFIDEAEFAAPEGVVTMEIDPANGLLATSTCPNKISTTFIKGTEPTALSSCQ